jgi:hypothetical protein
MEHPTVTREALNPQAIATAVDVLRQAVAAAPSDGESDTAAIDAAGEALLSLLEPGAGGHPRENARVTQSGLPVKVRVALAEVWRTLKIPGWDARTAGRHRDESLDFLDDLVELLATCPGVRPREPRLDYCLPEPGVIRWKSEVRNVDARLWRMLRRFLEGGCQPLDVDTVREGKKDKTVRNDIALLNNYLDAVDWPSWRLSYRNGHIQKKAR